MVLIPFTAPPQFAADQPTFLLLKKYNVVFFYPFNVAEQIVIYVHSSCINPKTSQLPYLHQPLVFPLFKTKIAARHLREYQAPNTYSFTSDTADSFQKCKTCIFLP